MILREAPDPSALSCADQDLVVHEMRILCVLGLYQCLDRNHRLVYILARAMDISGPEGARILDITPEAFRKRLSRARKQRQLRHLDRLSRETALMRLQPEYAPRTKPPRPTMMRPGQDSSPVIFCLTSMPFHRMPRPYLKS